MTLRQTLAKAKQALLREYRKTHPITPEVTECILDDFIEKVLAKEPQEDKREEATQ